MTKKWFYLGAVVCVAVLLVLCVVESGTNEPQAVEKQDNKTENKSHKNSPMEETNSFMTEVEIRTITTELLDIFYQLYFATNLEDKKDKDTSINGLMMTLTLETMKRKTAIDELIPRAEVLTHNKNQAVSTTAMSLVMGMKQMSDANQTMITYIRNEDVSNPKLSEFQYQMATLQTQNKDAFMTIVKGSALYPYVFIEFAKDDNASNTARISNQTRMDLISQIDKQYADVFKAEDEDYLKTGNRNAVLVIIRSYRNFLEKLKDITK